MTTTNQILCRQCTAPLEVEAGSALVTCGFCGTTNQVDKSRVILHYAVEPTIREEDAAAALRRWMAGNDTIKGLDQKAEIVSRRYELFPLWMINALRQDEERRYLEPAAATSVSEVKELTVPAADLNPYQPEMDDVAVDATVPLKTVLEWLQTEHGVDGGAIRAAAIVHVPLYVFKYRYEDETYAALVDAASGRVMANLFPTKREIPYVMLGGLAFLLNFCAATIPLIGYGVDGGAGFIAGLLLYLVVAAILAVPIFGIAVVVSARHEETHMSEATTRFTQGLLCPQCGSPVDVPAGARVVECGHCDQRLYVQGDSGIRRWQIRREVDRDAAAAALGTFYSGMDRARDLKKKAQLREIFLVYLPYWRVEALVTGYAFGNERKENDKWVPREVEFMRDLEWTDAAADVSEFGVHQLPLSSRPMIPYKSDEIHAEGMVFEPTEALDESVTEAEAYFEAIAKADHELDSVFFQRYHLLRREVDQIFYPLWIARYTYRKRVYQVAVDGVSGEVLYGKAPGNIWYRALMLAGGMAAGNFVLVVVTALTLRFLLSFDDAAPLFALVVPLGLGLGLIYRSYRIFRYSEEIEIRAPAAERALAQVGDRPADFFGEGLELLDKTFSTDLRRNLEL